jgi:hypothetical protein
LENRLQKFPTPGKTALKFSNDWKNARQKIAALETGNTVFTVS